MPLTKLPQTTKKASWWPAVTSECPTRFRANRNINLIKFHFITLTRPIMFLLQSPPKGATIPYRPKPQMNGPVIVANGQAYTIQGNYAVPAQEVRELGTNQLVPHAYLYCSSWPFFSIYCSDSSLLPILLLIWHAYVEIRDTLLLPSV